MAILKVYDGTSWITAVSKVYDGAVWVAKMAFYDGTAFVKLFVDAVITVTGKTITDLAPNGQSATAGIRVNTDGTMDQLVDATYTQIFASTDWRIPNGSGDAFHVKFTKGGLDPVPESGTLDAWLTITVDRLVFYQETTNDSEHSGTITVAISDDGGTTTLDSGAHPLSVTVGLPA